MPDVALAERPRALPAPGSEFPEIKFKPERVKATITVTMEFAGPGIVDSARALVDQALDLLKTAGAVSVNYEKL